MPGKVRAKGSQPFRTVRTFNIESTNEQRCQLAKTLPSRLTDEVDARDKIVCPPHDKAMHHAVQHLGADSLQFDP
jgi:hypothetical protein